ncbi:unnamed protein product [Chondrus crispus]|uniref:Uncharacterized protein n=1 Tax=Chondrus crispus TaxID=2769 RepID=R7QTG0_CHOCR|nr:unnamed protein product [Chondrus crispus]CDF40973.1 unnamed protein product [Chondrus crispus]|eukprot:XP_005711267.1 unnamed protein product [Chondrus crispus]
MRYTSRPLRSCCLGERRREELHAGLQVAESTPLPPTFVALSKNMPKRLAVALQNYTLRCIRGLCMKSRTTTHLELSMECFGT